MAANLNPKDYSVFYNWGTAIMYLAKFKNDETIFQDGIAKFDIAIELGSGSYNLACLYALKNDKENALKYLRFAVIAQEVKVELIKADEDWIAFKDDKQFVSLLNN